MSSTCVATARVARAGEDDTAVTEQPPHRPHNPATAARTATGTPEALEVRACGTEVEVAVPVGLDSAAPLQAAVLAATVVLDIVGPFIHHHVERIHAFSVHCLSYQFTNCMNTRRS